MERGFSADDLSLMLKLQGGAGFPRTDSEAAFMDFLKRIPSTSNLAAQASAQGLDAAQQQQLMQTAQHMQAAQASGLASSSSLGAPLAGQLQEVGRLNVGGIPRVPSLDLLRQLVQVNQTMSPSGAKAPASAPEGAPLESAPSSRSLPGAGGAVLPMPATVPMVATTLLPVPAAVPSSGLRHSRVQSGASAPCTDSESGGGTKEGQTKADIRRARRMLSNRESARRSRRRKQEHLSTLEEQIAKLNEEKQQLEERCEELEQGLRKRDEENRVLRREVEGLRRGDMGETSHTKAERGRAAQRGGGVPRVSSVEHIPKKACASRNSEWQDKQDAGAFAATHGKRKLVVEAS
ncbi:hypothetical protein WJX81_004026 [Elliptochloris bilobata]|uniref:BZIP domain-containing protein n=1 Tax=Elliptochloris bilobata TaxID=381761 RepID=A0AAW1R201_9CHLO